jgi:hypothetical protein
MTQVRLRLCYLCWNDGESVAATHRYDTVVDSFDVCEKHRKIVKAEGYFVEKLTKNPEEIEEDS